MDLLWSVVKFLFTLACLQFGLALLLDRSIDNNHGCGAILFLVGIATGIHLFGY